MRADDGRETCPRLPLAQRLLPSNQHLAEPVEALAQPDAAGHYSSAMASLIGLGIMGSRQAANLGARATRDRLTRPAPPPSLGLRATARRAESPRAVAQRSDVVITMVVDTVTRWRSAARRTRRRGARGRETTRCSSTCDHGPDRDPCDRSPFARRGSPSSRPRHRGRRPRATEPARSGGGDATRSSAPVRSRARGPSCPPRAARPERW